MNPEMFALMTKNALKYLEPDIFISKPAMQLLLAIAKQESNMEHRFQIVIKNGQRVAGPARGYFQFEQIGVEGVFNHPASANLMKKVCNMLDFDYSPIAVWRGIEGNETLAVCVARLLLKTDPAPLPDTESGGWQYYLRNWRPGKPHPDKWKTCWKLGIDLANKFY